ncbi:Mu transposase C-terminal domain-containing protein [Paraburkholderia caribensis]|uniref:Mu transposase C-terminal domain-containing protein n=1 Tax=Paraburkholderia caribensis TaxID=75105 RepID=UPI00078B80A3|nr:Mu transposase C-terminal domain-containing protein [Paraburkholderia caribensis]AMV48495.1 hypothetical protein ATN79_48500 [Paraburkholderia caribensis]
METALVQYAPPAATPGAPILVKNDLFENAGNTRFRLLEITEDKQAWIINISDPDCWPRKCSYTDLLTALAEKELRIVTSSGDAPLPFYSDAADARRKKAWTIVEPLIRNPAILEPKMRGPLVQERAQTTGASKTTINRYLRMYWSGGQSQQALIANFSNIGTKQAGLTHGRGRLPVDARYEVYQMDHKVDDLNVKEAVDKYYLKGEVSTLADAYVQMLLDKYSYLDGNGTKHIKPSGERPSSRQFRTVVKRHYSLETILRRKKGDKDFERDHNQSIVGALFEAICVGHIYEIDATIADVWLVARDDRAKIIGKPTMYLIYDRFSRLCVGLYAGLEHAGWEAAMQAILSIAEDKAALCLKYGVPYDPADWPAHGVFPQKFLGDCGEMISRNSSRICAGMESTIANTPPLSPQNKSTVECGFKVIHASIAAKTPGYEPPRNVTRRRGKHYDRDASLTLDEFIAIVIKAIIKHNRTQMSNYRTLPKAALREVPPVPTEIWADDLVNAAGKLSRYSADYLRFQLLPRDKATVTDEGIAFKDCLYSCDELVKQGWFVMAGNRGRWDVEVSYDRRLADSIIVHDPKSARRSYVCSLTRKSSHFKGYGFAEVAFVVKSAQGVLRRGEDQALQERANLHQFISGIAKPARAAAKKASQGKSRASRKADIAEDRNAEKAERRWEEAAIKPSITNGPALTVSDAPNNVVALHARSSERLSDATVSSAPPAITVAHSTAPSPVPEVPAFGSTLPLTLQEKLRLKRQELANGLSR